MRTLLDQALLVAAASALAGGGFRLASLAAPRGLERLVATAVFAAAGAVAWALLLGLAHLADSPFALALAAILSWLAVRRIAPAPSVTARGDLRAWRRQAGGLRGPLPWTVVGGVVGAVAWAEYRPVLGYDGLTYHLAESVKWAQSGTTGSIEPIIVGLPVANYPVTNEVAVAWLLGLSQSFAPVAAWSAFVLLVFLASAWLGLRSLEVPRRVAVLAIAAFCTTPLVLRQIVHAETDFPALAWLGATAGLAAASVRRPALLAPALVAAGLAIGTKTTTVAPAILALLAAGIALRGELPRLRVPLLAGSAAALVVGGIWYLRNLAQHGSPLWPLVSAPWGDPSPPQLARLDQSFLERPSETLSDVGARYYRDRLAGMLPVFVAGVLSPIWGRRRYALPFAAAALLAGLLWANAPYTGTSGIDIFVGVPINAVRYAAPALATGMAALAVSAARSRAGTVVASLVFGVALVWNVALYLADPFLPSDAVLAPAVASGAVAGLVAGVRLRPRRRLALIGTVAAAVALAWAAGGWVERHSRSAELDGGLIRGFAEQRAWHEGDGEVAISPVIFAALAGDRLEHPLSLVGAEESCARIERRIRRGWVVVAEAEPRFFPPLSVDRCLAGRRPDHRDGTREIYGTGGS